MDRRIADGLDKEINILGAEALKAVNAAQARAHDEAVDLASGAILVLSLNPNLKPFFLAQAAPGDRASRGRWFWSPLRARNRG